MDVKPINWEDRLTLFVGYLVHGKKRASTIRSYICAIKAVLLDGGIDLNEDKFLLSSLTKACKLVNDQEVRTRRPIHKGILEVILCSVDQHYHNQPFLAALYKALYTTSYFGLLRVNKLTAGAHAVKARDVKIGEN